MFEYAEANTDGTINTGTITKLLPPSEVSYSSVGFTSAQRVSRDGNVILQLPTRDTRERSWIWINYRKRLPDMAKSSHFSRYEELWNALVNLQYDRRLKFTPAKSEYVYLREDETGDFDRLVLNGSTWEPETAYVRAKILQVTRDTLTKGGLVVYPRTIMTFVLDDDNWNVF
jgi:hypothetical protein